VRDLTPRDKALVRLSVLTVLKGRVEEAERKARTTAMGFLKNGDSTTVSNPVGPDQEIAEVKRTKPKSRAVVTSRGEVEAWIVANYPGKAERKTRVIGSQADVIDVLREHAPFLLEEVVEVPDFVVNELVLKAQAAGKPVGFGGEIGEKAPTGIAVEPQEGQLRVSLKDGGADVVEEMWAAGIVDLDGQVLELPAGGAE
jgi:hypothetical protein